MRQFMMIIGILLIIFGIFGFSYEYFPYKVEKNTAAIGPIEISAEHQKYLYFPPLLSGLSLVAGIALMVMAYRK